MAIMVEDRVFDAVVSQGLDPDVTPLSCLGCSAHRRALCLYDKVHDSLYYY